MNCRFQIADFGFMDKNELKKELREVYKEGNELLSIIVAFINTTNRNIEKAKTEKIRNPCLHDAVRQGQSKI